MDTDGSVSRAIGSASPDSTRSSPDPNINSSHGLPRRSAIAPLLPDLSHKPELLFLDGTLDYYRESDLIWPDADTRIRQLSGGKKSLDDFAKLFFGIDNGSYVTVTYTFDDVVKALNTVQPYDWSGFFHTFIYDLHPEVPLEGFTQGGYRVVYNDIEPDWVKQTRSIAFAFAFCLGFSANKDGNLQLVWWDSPVFKAGVTPDMQLMAANDEKFTGKVCARPLLPPRKTTRQSICCSSAETSIAPSRSTTTAACAIHIWSECPTCRRVWTTC